MRLQGLCMPYLATAYSSTADCVRSIQETRRIVDSLPRRSFSERYLPRREVQADYWDPGFERRAITNVLIPGEFDG